MCHSPETVRTACPTCYLPRAQLASLVGHCLSVAARRGNLLGAFRFLRFDFEELLQIAEGSERLLPFLHRIGDRNQRRGFWLRSVMRFSLRRAVWRSGSTGMLESRPVLWLPRRRGLPAGGGHCRIG